MLIGPWQGGEEREKSRLRRVARNRQVEGDQERLVRDAVVVEMVLERIGPIRQAAEAGAHQRLGAVGQRREGAGHGIVAVFVEEGAKPALAEIERVELTVEVAPVRGRHARVRRQDIDDVLVHAPAGDELHRREQGSFLEALGRLRIIPAGHVAADVEPMSGGGEPAEQHLAAEDRPHEAEIVEMRPPGVRIVEQEGVAGGEPAVAPDLVDHRLDRERHGADEDRQALGPLDERRAARRMVDAVAGIAGFGDDRVEGRAVERRVHLVGDLLEPALEDRQRDGVESGHDAVS